MRGYILSVDSLRLLRLAPAQGGLAMMAPMDLI